MMGLVGMVVGMVRVGTCIIRWDAWEGSGDTWVGTCILGWDAWVGSGDAWVGTCILWWDASDGSGNVIDCSSKYFSYFIILFLDTKAPNNIFQLFPRTSYYRENKTQQIILLFCFQIRLTMK